MVRSIYQQLLKGMAQQGFERSIEHAKEQGRNSKKTIKQSSRSVPQVTSPDTPFGNTLSDVPTRGGSTTI